MFKLSFLGNISLSKCNDFFKGLYNRNKKLLIISTIIFFASLFIGVFVGYFLPDFIGNFVVNTVHQIAGQVKITTVSIFMNNLRVALMIYIGGIIGIVPAALLSFNGFILGSLVGYSMHSFVVNHSSLNLVDILSYIVPHSIFEIPAYIIAGAAGFRLTSIIIDLINSMRGKLYANDDYRKFKDALALLAIAVILLVIAAVIEANFTIPIGNYITGLHVHV